MEAKELRLGNYVELQIDLPEIKTKEVSQVLKLEAESSEIYCFSENIPDCDIWDIEDEQVKPIKLTREWLIKFGFDCVYDTDYEDWLYDKDSEIHELRIQYYNFNDENKSSFFAVEYLGQIEVKLKYVHQLQNLYFALTGNELIIKP